MIPFNLRFGHHISDLRDMSAKHGGSVFAILRAESVATSSARTRQFVTLCSTVSTSHVSARVPKIFNI